MRVDVCVPCAVKKKFCRNENKRKRKQEKPTNDEQLQEIESKANYVFVLLVDFVYDLMEKTVFRTDSEWWLFEER